MAYNYFPGNYNPNYGMNPYYQQVMAQQQQPAQPPQMRSSVVYTNSKDEAVNYPVAPGNSVFFINTSAKECYEKTAPLSPMDPFIFKIYDLVERVAPNGSVNAPNSPSSEKEGKDIAYATKSEIGAIWGEIEALKEKLAKEMTEDAE